MKNNLPLMSEASMQASKAAEQLAKESIDNNHFDKERFDKHYTGGVSRDNLEFAYQFAAACVDYTVRAISKNESKVESTKKLLQAVSHLNDSEFAFGLDYFKAKIASYKIEGLETPEAFQQLVKEAIKGTPLESNQIAKQVTHENKEAVLDKISVLKENTNNVSSDYKLK